MGQLSLRKGRWVGVYEILIAENTIEMYGLRPRSSKSPPPSGGESYFEVGSTWPALVECFRDLREKRLWISGHTVN